MALPRESCTIVLLRAFRAVWNAVHHQHISHINSTIVLQRRQSVMKIGGPKLPSLSIIIIIIIMYIRLK